MNGYTTGMRSAVSSTELSIIRSMPIASPACAHAALRLELPGRLLWHLLYGSCSFSSSPRSYNILVLRSTCTSENMVLVIAFTLHVNSWDMSRVSSLFLPPVFPLFFYRAWMGFNQRPRCTSIPSTSTNSRTFGVDAFFVFCAVSPS